MSYAQSGDHRSSAPWPVLQHSALSARMIINSLLNWTLQCFSSPVSPVFDQLGSTSGEIQIGCAAILDFPPDYIDLSYYFLIKSIFYFTYVDILLLPIIVFHYWLTSNPQPFLHRTWNVSCSLSAFKVHSSISLFSTRSRLSSIDHLRPIFTSSDLTFPHHIHSAF